MDPWTGFAYVVVAGVAVLVVAMAAALGHEVWGLIRPSRSPVAATELILARLRVRRDRQRADGYDDGHDDEHVDGSLVRAALGMLFDSQGLNGSEMWPWPDGWAPSPDDPVREIEIAAALLVAELERRERAAKRRRGSR